MSQLADLGRFADDLLEPVRLAGAGAQLLILQNQPVPFGAAGNRVEEFLRRERLGQVINRARFDRLDGELGSGERRDHQHGHVRPAQFQLAEEFVAAHAVEPRIGDDHEELLLLEQAERGLGRIHGADLVTFFGHHRFQRKPHVLLVIDNQQRWQFDTHYLRNFITVLAGKSRMNRVPFPSSDSTCTVPP